MVSAGSGFMQTLKFSVWCSGRGRFLVGCEVQASSFFGTTASYKVMQRGSVIGRRVWVVQVC